jgi:flagellar protein FlbD
VILLRRFNGPVFALNPDLIERADHTPDTVITLVDGTKYVISESLDELMLIMRRHRAGVLADAELLINGQFRDEGWPVARPVHDSSQGGLGTAGPGPVLESVQSGAEARLPMDDGYDRGSGPAESANPGTGRHPSRGVAPVPPSDVIPLHRRGQ